jgi:hypothetical protein
MERLKLEHTQDHQIQSPLQHLGLVLRHRRYRCSISNAYTTARTDM